MGHLQFAFLGELQARRGPELLDLGSAKQRAVLGLLLAAAPHPVSLETLTDELWGASPPSNPRRNLQVYVSALRRVLGEEAPVRSSAGGYRIDVAPGQVDAHVFAREVARAVTLLSASTSEEGIDLLETALGRWRGRAWQGLHDVRYLATDADRLEQRRREARGLLARARLTVGRHHEALPDLQALVAEDYLDEEARHDLMLALHRAGRRDDALAVYRQGRDAIVNATGLDPGAALQRLHQQVLGDDPALLVEDAAIRARRHLPAPVTRLVGRTDEVGDVVRLATEGVRLITLIGPGGVGKTRVALAAAHRLAAQFPDGVWFAGLSEIADVTLVPEAIAEALGLDVSPDGAEVSVRRNLSARRLLLVVDNLEHVDEAGPFLARLLADAPGLHLLATSRVPLRLYGEHVLPLAPLPEHDAIPLFTERARAVEPRFAAVAEDVREVCRGVDNLPLALELVAARVDRVPVGSILTQLAATGATAGLDLAADGPRDRTSRQRTLRGAIDWSVDLLDRKAAEGFRRLSVFLGGFDAESSRAVAGVDRTLLDRLAAASLLVRQPGGERFSMLRTVREHAAESLPATERDDVRRAHATWFHDVARSCSGGLRGPDMRTWLTRLREERANMRAALAWWQERAADDAEAAERMLEMTSALGLFWYRDGPGSADVEWLPVSLSLGAAADEALRGRAWYALTICRAEQGRSADALAAGRECRALLPADDETWRARVLNTLGGITRDMGRPDEAAPMIDESIALRRRIGDPTLSVPIALANRAMVARDLGELEIARACLEECLAVAREDDDQLDAAVAQAGLADVAVAESDPVLARRLLGRAVPTFVELHQDYRLMECLETLAAVAVLEGRLDVAATLVGAADAALAAEGSNLVPADRAQRERRVERHLAALDPATLEAARERGRGLGLAEALAVGTA